MRLWLPALAAACIAGSLMPPPWALGFALALAAAARYGRRTILFAVGVALVVAAFDTAWRDPAVRALPHGLVTVSGIVVEAPEGERTAFTLARTAFGTLEVRAHGSVRAAEHVTVRGRLLRSARLRTRGVAALLDGRIVTREQGQGATAIATRVRAWVRLRLETLPQPAAALLDGAMVGERGALDADAAAAFSETGTTHVLVTAGLHLGAFAALLLIACEALGAGRIAASLLALLGVALFVTFSGAHLPAVRAGVMAACALIARAGGRAPLGPEAIAVAAIVVTLWEPWSTGSASFLLSFSCVGAIALFASPIARSLEGLRMPHLLREGVALTLATQIGVWPLQAAFFLQLAPYAPLANALVVPMVAPALGFGMLTVANPLFAPLAALACGWILGVVRAISALPYAHLVATPPPWWAIAVYDATALWLGLRRTRTALACVLAAAALCLWPPRPGAGDTRIVALDVGQGQAVAVLSRGHATMVDGAPAQQGPRTLVPSLVRAGIHRVDALVVSHPHEDHFAGFSALMAALRVDRLIDGGWSAHGAFGALLRDAEAARVPVAHLRAGAAWRTGDAEVAILAPFAQPLRNTHDDVDNDSLIVRVRAANCTALIMGDAESEEERALIDAYPPDELRADVLVVGHHGSGYSSSAAFLAIVRPRIAIASVGLRNPYGLPSPQALARLRAAGVRVLLTSREGTITLDTAHECAVQTTLPA
ncbi:DNA internalization-related competence protein ComEC/Rec2 [bacterium]|nr:MAG: DNA internalization-related competence protein ComEC/Rec2 [bacterium]